MSADERRKFQRLNLSVGVNWKKSQFLNGNSVEHSSTTKNISEGGLRLILDEDAKIGDILEMNLSLPGGKNIHLKGRVVWVEKNEIIGARSESVYEGGVQFIDISDSEKLEIVNFLFKSRP